MKKNDIVMNKIFDGNGNVLVSQVGTVIDVCENGDLILKNKTVGKWRAAQEKCYVMAEYEPPTKHKNGLVVFN